MTRARLGRIRSRLKGLGLRRWASGLGNGASSILIAALLTGAALFLVDWTFGMDRLQRGLAMALAAGGVLWWIRRFSLPHLKRREDVLEMALVVEKREGIDSDLVAALEFESPEAPRWGSPELEEAVIDSAEKRERRIDVLAGFSWRGLIRRSVALLFLGAALSAAAIRFPGHASAFLDRLLLGRTHYPTRCIIREISINGKIALPASRSKEAHRIPWGRPLSFEVRAAGELPAAGKVELSRPGKNLKTSVDLAPAGDRGLYTGRYPRLTDPASYQVFLGDAWTDPESILLVSLPAVSLEFEVVPPAYAKAAGNGEAASALQAAVIEGSRITPRLVSTGKPLRKVSIAISGKEHPLEREDGTGLRWTLRPEGTPLERLSEPMGYEVQVEDEDGLGLEEPLRGFLRIKPDRPPQVAAGLLTKNVLPTARPNLSYGATDDHGIALLRIRYQVTRGEEKLPEGEEAIPIEPSGATPAVLRGRRAFDLAPLKLRVGDQVTIALEATDFRGDLPGRSSRSEPIVLHVTDERGVLAAMMESDEKSARQLDAIIQKQLGIGDER